MLRRTVAAALILILILPAMLASALEPAYSFSEGYMSSPFYERLIAVQLTGVQRTDLVNVALSQVGYHEGELGDYTGSDPDSEGNCTEYNLNYYGWEAAGDNYAWCAVFFTWCARNARISRDIIHTYNRASASPFGLIYVQFAFREPLPGDVAFVDNNEWKDPDHVAIVYRADDEYIYTVEGNTENAVRIRRYERATGYNVDEEDVVHTDIHILYYGVAWYTTGSEGGAICSRHIYTQGCEDKCAVCGAKHAAEYAPDDRTVVAAGAEISAYAKPYAKPKYVAAVYGDTEHLHVVSSVGNSIGELWYRLEDGTFVRANETHYVYQPEELTPVVTVLDESEESYRVRIDSADENVLLAIAEGANAIEDARPVFKSGKELWSDGPFSFTVKAFHKGVESEPVSFAFEGADELETDPAEVGGGMAAFTEKRRYLGFFDDVDESEWFYENVKKTFELGLLNGYSDAEYGTDGSVTAAQAIAIAARLHSVYTTGILDFEPSPEDWFAPYLDYALDNGLVSEAPADPAAELDRKGFVSVLSGVFPAEELEHLVDVPDGSIPDVSGEQDYVNFIYALYRAGIIRGTGELHFNGNAPVSRVEAAAIITRFVCPELRAA